jgi:hypothetical protein
VIVCVSTECFPDLPLAKAMERLAEEVGEAYEFLAALLVIT